MLYVVVLNFYGCIVAMKVNFKNCRCNGELQVYSFNTMLDKLINLYSISTNGKMYDFCTVATKGKLF